VAELVGPIQFKRGTSVEWESATVPLAAGEMGFARTSEGWHADRVSNQSTGYCPDPDSWPAVAAALDRAGIARPDGFTHALVFRRCE